MIVPAVMIKSACRGVARKTSEPKREISNFDIPDDIISMAQQLVPKVSGQTELERARLAIGEMIAERASVKASTVVNVTVSLSSSDTGNEICDVLIPCGSFVMMWSQFVLEK